MKTQLQKDFLEVRRIKESLLSKIDKLQSECNIAYELGNTDKGDKLDEAIEHAFSKMWNEIESFEQAYKTSYDNLETDWLINNKKF